MKRSAYIGDSGVQSSGNPSIPMQAETQAYLGRFSTAPSDTFRNALNQAIYRWKQAGVWSLVQDLWLLCGDTQVDSLRNLISGARDATVTGSPTFTARAGFSGLSPSSYVSLPFSTTGVVVGSGFVWMGACNLGGWDYFNNGPATIMGQSVTHAGAVVMGWTGPNSVPGSYVSGTNPFSLSGRAAAGLAGAAVLPEGIRAGGNAPSAVTLSPVSANNALMTQLSAYGVFPTANAAQLRKFVSILQTLMEDLGFYG